MNFESKNGVNDIFDELIERYPILKDSENSIWQMYELIKASYEKNKILYIAGNGGSAADSEHIAGELMKSFRFKRPVDTNIVEYLRDNFEEEGYKLSTMLEGGLGAIALPSMMSSNTATINDIGGDYIFAQEIMSVGKEEDVFLGISTSGNSKNIVNAMMVARAKKMITIGLSGSEEGKMDSLCDLVVRVPERDTFRIQELHLPIYHAVCAMLESYFWGNTNVSGNRC